VVVSEVEFVVPHITTSPETKFVPFTVKVNPGLPAVVELGLRDVIEGDAATVKVAVPDVPPPGFATVTFVAPALEIRLAVTAAVN
jgi:hypothetical protein